MIDQAIDAYALSDSNKPLEISITSDVLLHTVKVRGVQPSRETQQRADYYNEYSNVGEC